MRDDAGRSSTAVVKFSDALKRAGISKLVLHAWERRFNVELSERTVTGRRYMTDLQVERLRLLKLCTEAGFRIGAIIQLPDDELVRIAAEHSLRLDLCATLDAVQRLDGAALGADLERRLEALGPVAFALRVAAPLMKEVGRRWHEGSLSIAAEHLASAEIRRFLAACLARVPVAPGALKAIATTPEGEMHELGALVVALISRSQGIDTLYLGPNLPNDQIVGAARQYGAGLVLLSCMGSARRSLPAQLATLRAALPPEILIIAGGLAAEQLTPMQGLQVLNDMQTLEAILQDLARSAKPDEGCARETS